MGHSIRLLKLFVWVSFCEQRRRVICLKPSQIRDSCPSSERACNRCRRVGLRITWLFNFRIIAGDCYQLRTTLSVAGLRWQPRSITRAPVFWAANRRGSHFKADYKCKTKHEQHRGEGKGGSYISQSKPDVGIVGANMLLVCIIFRLRVCIHARLFTADDPGTLKVHRYKEIDSQGRVPGCL